ncbi:MAG: hypothetical protein ACE5GB_07085 [Acidimicrobiales bacterium]
MNHTRIAAEAIRFRLSTVRRPLADGTAWNVDQMAASTVAAGEPAVDSAIRRIATAWVGAGFSAHDLTRPWTDPRVIRLFTDQPDLVDALDDIVLVATRSAAA